MSISERKTSTTENAIIYYRIRIEVGSKFWINFQKFEMFDIIGSTGWNFVTRFCWISAEIMLSGLQWTIWIWIWYSLAFYNIAKAESTSLERSGNSCIGFMWHAQPLHTGIKNRYSILLKISANVNAMQLRKIVLCWNSLLVLTFGLGWAGLHLFIRMDKISCPFDNNALGNEHLISVRFAVVSMQ